jgi:hypothetical protein
MAVTKAAATSNMTNKVIKSGMLLLLLVSLFVLRSSFWIVVLANTGEDDPAVMTARRMTTSRKIATSDGRLEFTTDGISSWSSKQEVDCQESQECRNEIVCGESHCFVFQNGGVARRMIYRLKRRPTDRAFLKAHVIRRRRRSSTKSAGVFGDDTIWCGRSCWFLFLLLLLLIVGGTGLCTFYRTIERSIDRRAICPIVGRSIIRKKGGWRPLFVRQSCTFSLSTKNPTLSVWAKVVVVGVGTEIRIRRNDTSKKGDSDGKDESYGQYVCRRESKGSDGRKDLHMT